MVWRRGLLAAVALLGVGTGGIAMAHGQPDYGVSTPKVSVYQLTDIAEYAARTGSPVTFDRRGDVLWHDDFESANLGKWETPPPPATAVLTTDAAHNGNQSVKLDAPNIGYNGAIIRYLPYPATVSRFGLEAHFSLGAEPAAYSMRMRLYDGESMYQAWLMYNSETKRLRLPSNGLNIADGLNLLEHQYMWHAMKLVVDLKAKTWERVIVNNHEYVLSNVPMWPAITAFQPTLWIQLVVASVGNPATAYVDDVIVTQNEP